MRFNWGRLPGEVRAIGGFQRRALPARPGSSCHWVRRSPTIRRPGAGRGPVPLVFIVCLVACFRLAVIGRVSPRRATIFLVATRKVDKETPPAAAPARAGALAPPEPGGSRRNSPSRAQTSTRQFPPAAGCARRYRRGRLLPARLRHCRRRALPLSRARHPGAFCCLAGSVALLQCSPSPSLQCAVCFRPSIRWTPLTTASTRAPAMTPAAPLITTGASAPHRPPSCSESCSIQ